MSALACEAGPIQPPEGELPVAGGGVENALIRDQYHGGGTTVFAFLPPIATQQPSAKSSFESRLAPEVRIEQLAENGSVARTVATYTGRRSNGNDDNVRRNVGKELYVLRLHANRLNLDPRSTYRIRVLASTGGARQRCGRTSDRVRG